MFQQIQQYRKNESIWEVEFAGDYTSEVRSEGRIGNLIGIKCPDQSSDQSLIDKQDPGFGYAYFWSTPKLYELYVNNKDINRMNWNIAPFEYIAAVSGKGVTGRQFEYGKMAEVKKQYWDISYSYGIGNMAKKTGDYEKPEAESEKTIPAPAANTVESMNSTVQRRTRITLLSTFLCCATPMSC